MNDVRIKNIIIKCIGNDDPYWINPIYKVVKQIIELKDGEERIMSDLLDDSNYTSKQLFEIYNAVNKVCQKLNIDLDFSQNEDKVSELHFNLPFIKKTKDMLLCPNCGEKLTHLMPDRKYLFCDKCNKYYTYDNGTVGNETNSPYNKKDVLY